MTKLLTDAAYFAQRIEEETARSRRAGTVFTVVVFTSIPGHGEHPEVACVEALPSLLANIRDTDTVARVGDDRIAVLLIDADGSGSLRAAKRLIAKLESVSGRWEAHLIASTSSEALERELGVAA